MLVWLLVLLLLFGFTYAVYRVLFIPEKEKKSKEIEHHYTFKI